MVIRGDAARVRIPAARPYPVLAGRSRPVSYLSSAFEVRRRPGPAIMSRFALFSDPDGNRWVFQEVRQRVAGQ
jgi:hypothetical protein